MSWTDEWGDSEQATEDYDDWLAKHRTKPVKHEICAVEQSKGKIYDGMPGCKGKIVAHWNGIKCNTCGGWFCY